MTRFKFTFLALACIATSASADATYKLPGSETTFRIGGYINAGTHQQRGDQADWENIFARQSAADYYLTVAGNPSSTPGALAAAKAQYDRTLSASPYWENLNTSLSDIYFRLRVAAEQPVGEDMKVVAFLERDFRTKRNDLQTRHIGVNDDDDDVTRRAFVGVSGSFGQVRFGRDESAMDHVRELLYMPIEKDLHEYHVLVQPVSAMGRHDNSLIYSYDNGKFGVTAGAAFKTQEEFVSESSHSFSAKYAPMAGLTIAAGYVGGKLKTDTQGNIVEPDLTFMGLSNFDVSEVFENVAYNPAFQLDQRQVNVGAAYRIGSISVGATVFKGKYTLQVKGEDVNRARMTSERDIDMRGGQVSLRYAVNDRLSLGALYTRSKNQTSGFSIMNIASLDAVYNLTPSALIYGSVGRNRADASNATIANAGVRFGF